MMNRRKLRWLLMLACTPDIYVFDKNIKLAYRGQLDDSRPGNGLPVTGKDLRHALDCLVEGKDNTEPAEAEYRL